MSLNQYGCVDLDKNLCKKNHQYSLRQLIKQADQIDEFLSNNVGRISNKEELKIFLDELLCSKCKQIPFNPIICQTCQLMYCQKCNEQLKLEDSNLFQQCCKKETQLNQVKIVPEALNRLLKKIKFYCKNKKLGCNSIEGYTDIQNHEMNQCDFSYKACTHIGCDMNIYKKDLNKHKDRECQFRFVKCKFCRTMHRYLLLDLHHSECDLKPTPCKWCSVLYVRKVIQDHEQNCDHRDYFCDSCKQNMKFYKYASHLGYQCQKKQRNFYQRSFYKQKMKRQQLEQQQKEKQHQIDNLKELLIELGVNPKFFEEQRNALGIQYEIQYSW